MVKTGLNRSVVHAASRWRPPPEPDWTARGAQPAQPPDSHSEGDSAPLLASRSPMHFGDVLRQGGVHRGRAGLAQPAALPDLQQIRPRTTLRLLPQRLLLLPQHLLAVQQPDIGQTGKVLAVDLLAIKLHAQKHQQVNARKGLVGLLLQPGLAGVFGGIGFATHRLFTCTAPSPTECGCSQQ